MKQKKEIRKPKEPEAEIIEEAPSWWGKLWRKKAKSYKKVYVYNLMVLYKKGGSCGFEYVKNTKEWPKDFTKVFNWWWKKTSKIYKLNFISREKSSELVGVRALERVDIKEIYIKIDSQRVPIETNN